MYSVHNPWLYSEIRSCIHFQVQFYFTWSNISYTEGVIAEDITFIRFHAYTYVQNHSLTSMSYPEVELTYVIEIYTFTVCFYTIILYIAT